MVPHSTRCFRLFPVLFLLSIILKCNPTQSKPSIVVTPTTISRSGDTVVIRWSGIESPTEHDLVGIYSPPTSSDEDYIGYLFLNNSRTWRSGSGSISLPLVNLRSNYSFRIFHWNGLEINRHDHHYDHDHDDIPLPDTTNLLASSEEVSFLTGQGPEQIHLAFADAEDAMRVMYVTRDLTETYVRYGEREGDLDNEAPARIKRYEREHMCDAPANASVGWRDPGYIHDALIMNLKKRKRYYYKVGDDNGGWSETHSFVSRNWDDDSDETIAFLFGDMGAATAYKTFLPTQDESTSTMKWILRDIEALGNKAAFISHIGDISYARGYAWLWDHFFTQIEPVASRVAYHVCIGNHEYNWPLQPWKPDWSSNGKDGGGECGVPYSLRFNMPGNSSEPTETGAPATKNLYYSFDAGAVHFVYLSTETNFLPGSNQYSFLKHDLETVDRNKTPFVVVQGHRPMYTTSSGKKDAALRAKMHEHLEPLLVNNKVTLALWGHVHRYERFCPLNNCTCGDSTTTVGQKAYTVHLVIGMGGQDWQNLWQQRKENSSQPVFPQPKESLYRGGEFGYIRLVATKQKLVISYVGNHDGEVHDTVQILASGEVVNGNGDEGQIVESTLLWYVQVGTAFVLGVFVGYILGFISRSRNESVKTKET